MALRDCKRTVSAGVRPVASTRSSPFRPVTSGGAMPRQIIQTLVDLAYPLRATPAARRDRTMARLVTAELIEDAAVTGAALLPIFVNTSPNFRHLYKMDQVQRPFDR